MLYSVDMEYLSGEEGAEEMRSSVAEAVEGKDEEVLAASVSRPSLFAILVRKYEEPFLRKAQGILHDAQDAEDVVQEAFVKIYLNAAKFKVVEGAQFSSWGYRILINTALTHYMKKKREKGMRADIEPEILELIPDKDLKQFEKKEFIDEVASVLTRMPPMFAQVLNAFFIEGKSQEEIAATEGVTIGAIKTRVHRAKAEFRRVYKTITTTI